MQPSILIVDDDTKLQSYLRSILTEEGYSVSTAETGAKAREVIETVNPDVVVLDLMLPDIAGESLCREFKKLFPQIIVIMLTGKSQTDNIVEGLSMGADDYMTKPFKVEELLARIKARTRVHLSENEVLTFADLTVHTDTHEVVRSGKQITLTPQEYRLLHYLMQNPNRVLSREMILNRLWMSSPDVETRVVDVYIGYLRKKIDTGFPEKLIRSMRGFGYMLKTGPVEGEE
jgi:two-component system response regulator MprA